MDEHEGGCTRASSPNEKWTSSLVSPSFPGRTVKRPWKDSVDRERHRGRKDRWTASMSRIWREGASFFPTMATRRRTRRDSDGDRNRAKRRRKEEETEAEDVEEAEELPAEDETLVELRRTYRRAAQNAETKLESLDLSEEVWMELVSRVVRHVIFKSQRSGAPITRPELSQVVLEDSRLKELGRKGLATLVIAVAQHKLLDAFGLEMKEVSRVRPRHAAYADRKKALTGDAEVRVFILRSALPTHLRRYSQLSRDDSSRALAFVVTTLVKLAGDSLGEDALWKYLGELGIKKGARDHPAFGDVEDELKKLVRQRYLIKEKCTQGLGEDYEYQLAENAVDKFPREKMDAHFKELLKRAGISSGESEGDAEEKETKE